MRWELINATPEHQIYRLFNEDRELLSLELNPVSNTARITFNKQKRVFLIRKEGMRRHRTVIRNEYGVKIGELGQENREPFIEFNDERFFYRTEGSSVVIHRGSPEKPGISFDLDVRTQASKANKAESVVHPALLLAVCWYLYNPVVEARKEADVLA